MMNINMSYAELKDFAEQRNLVMQYYETDGLYFLAAKDDYFFASCKINNSVDIDDFELNYKDSSNLTMTDGTGRSFFRSAITEKGWAYLALCLSINAFDSSNPVRCKKLDGTSYDMDVKYFDEQFGGDEITSYNQLTLDTSAKRMEVILDIEQDYELIKGQTFSDSSCAYPLFLDVSNGAADLGDQYVRPFVLGLDLSDSNHYESDGKAPKKLLSSLDGVPVVANKFKIYLRRTQAISTEYKFSMLFEFYRSVS